MKLSECKIGEVVEFNGCIGHIKGFKYYHSLLKSKSILMVRVDFFYVERPININEKIVMMLIGPTMM